MDNKAYVIDLDTNSVTQKKKEHEENVYSFEEAVTLTEVGKFHYLLLLVCGLCFMSVMIEIMGLSFIMIFAKCDFNFTVAEQGALASSGFLGVVLSSHAMGFLADTWGRVKTLKMSLFLSFLSSVISVFSVNTWMLIIFRFFNGIFISGCQACVFSLIGEYHGKKTRVRYVTLLSTFLPLGLIYLPLIAMFILPIQIDTIILGLKFSSWRILLFMDTLMSIFAFIGLLFIPESPKFLLIQGHHDEAVSILRRNFNINTGKPESDYPVKKMYVNIIGASLTSVNGFKDAIKLIWSQTIPLFYKSRALHTINISSIMFIIYGIAQGTFMWFPIILKAMVANSDSGYTVCQTIGTISEVNSNMTSSSETECNGTVDTFMFEVLCYIGVAYTVIYLVFSFTIDIIGKKRLLIIWLVIAGSCCLLIHWLTVFYVTIILLTLTMAVGNCAGIVSTISIEYFPTNVSAMGICFIMMVGRLGSVFGSNIIGVILFSSCDLLFYVFTGIIIVLTGMCYCLPNGPAAPFNEKCINQKDATLQSSSEVMR